MCLFENDKLLNLQPGKKYDSWDSYMSVPEVGRGSGASRFPLPTFLKKHIKEK